MMAPVRSWSHAVGVLCLLAGLIAGCHRSNAVLAELETREGSVDRDYAAKVGAWESAPLKSSFRVGDAVRTGAQSQARLRLSDHSALSLDDGTLIRFLAKPPGTNAQGLDVQSGQAELEVADEALRLDTGTGFAQIEAGTRLRLTKTSAGTRFAVLIGSAQLDGEARPLHAGDSLEIGIGRAVIERSAVAPSAAAAHTPPPAKLAPEASLSTADARGAGGTEKAGTRGRGPEAIDMSAVAGESLVIHDPRPPTAIGFSTGKCAGTAVIEVGRGRKLETEGEGAVHASFSAGVHRYRALCLATGNPFAEGTVSVLHDAGNRALPRSAPVTRVDTDGRRYTVLYQNLLPKMSVRWPAAPTTGPFKLSVRSSRGTQSFALSQPSYSFAAGAFAEGSHDLWFEATGARSRDTTVVIQFDNAAPTASITAPPDGSFATGASVAVAGTALPGWTVSVGGQELAQDLQHRFSGQAQASGGTRALAIRFTNPQRGVQFYLRRSSN